jgi:hypothetical protein
MDSVIIRFEMQSQSKANMKCKSHMGDKGNKAFKIKKRKKLWLMLRFLTQKVLIFSKIVKFNMVARIK